MPLSEQEEEPPSPNAAWTAAYRFVGRCREWTVAEIDRRRATGRATDDWELYLRFTDHTLRELRAGTLDDWFVGDPRQPPPARSD